MEEGFLKMHHEIVFCSSCVVPGLMEKPSLFCPVKNVQQKFTSTGVTTPV